MSNTETALHVPAQVIPIPTSLSPQAQAFLAAATQRLGAADQDTGAQAAAAVAMLGPAAARFQGEFHTVDLPGGAKLYRAIPADRQGKLARVAFMDIHGGAFVAGGGQMCQLLARIRAADYGVEVFSVDYRLLPGHPYPAALDDCMAAYQEVLKHYRASDLVVGGASAGGNLAAALMLRATQEGVPMPAALMLMTPALDMTASGDSSMTNRYLDVMLYGGTMGIQYGAGHDLKDPYISPLFGTFTQTWPPTILTTGTRDLLLSDTVRMHRALRRAGVKAQLHVQEAGSHGGFMGQAPEDLEILAECRQFMRAAWDIM